jgi:hypothetical protein
MPETSSRQNTRDRAKVTKKVAEHKRKTRKAAKKDVTWKSSALLYCVYRIQLMEQKSPWMLECQTVSLTRIECSLSSPKRSAG